MAKGCLLFPITGRTKTDFETITCVDCSIYVTCLKVEKTLAIVTTPKEEAYEAIVLKHERSILHLTQIWGTVGHTKAQPGSSPVGSGFFCREQGTEVDR